MRLDWKGGRRAGGEVAGAEKKGTEHKTVASRFFLSTAPWPPVRADVLPDPDPSILTRHTLPHTHTSTTTPRRAPAPAAAAPATASADPAPGVALAKSGNSFPAVKDIEAIQEVLPHR